MLLKSALKFSNELFRIDIREHVRQLKRYPWEETGREVERLRQKLSAELLLLESLRSAYTDDGIISPEVFGDKKADESADEFNDLDDEEHSGPDQDVPRSLPLVEDRQLPECKTLILPSTHMPDAHLLRRAEFALRIAQVKQNLVAIREAVAEKSFQYCHVMWSAPTKSVRTRARASISKINAQISYCCRVYGRARAALVLLNADEEVLHKFRVLSKEDVRASTAILNPNIEGSSSLRLTWIWQMQPGQVGLTSEAMQECMLLKSCIPDSTLTLFMNLSSTCTLASCQSSKNEMGRGTSSCET